MSHWAPFSVEFRWRGMRMKAAGNYIPARGATWNDPAEGREVETDSLFVCSEGFAEVADIWPMVEALPPEVQDEVYGLIDEALGQDGDGMLEEGER